MAQLKLRVSGMIASAVVLAVACGDTGGDNSADSGTGNGGGGTPSGSAGTSSLVGSTGADGAGANGGGTGGSCAAESAEAKLQPVYLAFAFDVSGSMGKLDRPYHDPALKWEPVVTATKAFFTDPESRGISASLTFFPIDSDEGEVCDARSYGIPDVRMTGLPSAAFGDAIDGITPATPNEWRGGTPTLAVITGVFDFIQPLAAADPGSKYAFVLISDGYPQGCDDNSITSVAELIADRAGAIPTYVIGVKNPPGGPDTVTNLNDIAVAGGTDRAFIVETGDPEQTKADFKAVIDAIRTQSISCEIQIPPPPAGQEFDATKVNVTYTVGGTATTFSYDEQCAGEDSWHYDDQAAPTKIVLCASTCQAVQANLTAQLQVEFGCETVAVPR